MKKSALNEVIKAVACDIKLGESVLDTYLLPSGEKRIGIENIGLALGYDEKFFFDRTKHQPEAVESLRNNGYSGEQVWVKILKLGQPESESFSAKTISIRDFVKLVTYEAVNKKNINAIILLAAFAETGIDKILEEVFAGREIDFLLEKISHYTKWTQQEWEEALAYNREDLLALYPWGAPPSLI